MKYPKFSVILILLFFSCSKESELHKKFNCNVVDFKNSTITLDFNKNFKLTTLSNWNTKLYYNKYQSEIYTADTTKQLSKSLILITSFTIGNLNFDAEFYKKTDSILKKNNLQVINFGKQSFQSKPANWYVVKGTKNGFSYHQFNLTTKRSENTYFNAYSEIYGENNISDRICETISILEKIEFLQ